MPDRKLTDMICEALYNCQPEVKPAPPATEASPEINASATEASSNESTPSSEVLADAKAPEGAVDGESSTTLAADAAIEIASTSPQSEL